MYCTKCGHKNPDDDTICQNCGEPLQGPKVRNPRPDQRSSELCYWDEEAPGIPRFIVYLIGAVFIVTGISIVASVWIDIDVELVAAAVILILGLGVIWYGITKTQD